MTGRHPSDETLLRLAAGWLPPGPAVVVESHVENCPHCRERLARFEATGGTILDEIEPEPMHPTAFATVMGMLGGPVAIMASASRRRLPNGVEMPKALDACEIGPWRWFGFGVRASFVRPPGATATAAMLLHVKPNRRLPEHGHSGLEFTLVLSGSYSDETGRYGPGDLAELDQDVEHQPVVDPDGACVCLVALEGRMRLTGWLGRITEPFMRT